MDEAGDQHEQLKREQICHQWQLKETDGNDTAQTRLARRRVVMGGERRRRSSG